MAVLSYKSLACLTKYRLPKYYKFLGTKHLNLLILFVCCKIYLLPKCYLSLIYSETLGRPLGLAYPLWEYTSMLLYMTYVCYLLGSSTGLHLLSFSKNQEIHRFLLPQCEICICCCRILHGATSLELRAFTLQCLLAMNRPDLARKQLASLQEIEDDSTLTQLAQAWLNLSQVCRLW